MKTLTARFAAAALALAAFVLPVRAAPALDPVPLIESWLLPRYDMLAAAGAEQQAAWATFCAAPSAAGVDKLKDAFLKTADAWTAVEFVTMGPISLSLRADRFNFFPDRRNAIQRGMAEVLASTDEGRFEAERFAKSNAAAQGLPALERLLYEQGAADALAGGAEAAVRCKYGTAIALNLAGIAKDVRQGWGDRNSGAFGAVVSGKGDPVFFPDAAAVPGMILTDLSGAYQRVSDTRILPVLGNGDPKPTLAEGWRSGRSGQVVKVMITSADALLQEIAKQLPSRTQWAVNKAATTADKAAADFPADLGAAAQSSDGPAKVQAALKAFKAAQITVYRPIAAYFGVSLGFNALDGD